MPMIERTIQQWLPQLGDGFMALWQTQPMLVIGLVLLLLHWIYIVILRVRLRLLRRRLVKLTQQTGIMPESTLPFSARWQSWRMLLWQWLTWLLTQLRPVVRLLHYGYAAFLQTTIGQRFQQSVQGLYRALAAARMETAGTPTETKSPERA